MSDLSIVTVTRNDSKFLETSFESIKKEKINLNFEYIVIDGNSSDNTLELIKKYDQTIDFSISENDHGIYDAMNKGLSNASGKYVIFLNSGDVIFSLAKVINDIKDLSNTENRILLYASRFTWPNSMSKIITPHFSFCQMPTSHQAIAFPTKIANEFQYNLTYKFSADYDLYLTILSEKQFSYKVFFDVIVKTAPVGFTNISKINYLKECYEINLKYNNKILAMLRFLLELTKLLIKKFINKWLPESSIVVLRKLRGGGY